MRTPPNREIDFDCACVACVRAKLRERGDSSVASVRQANLWGSRRRPFVLDFQSQPGELQIGLSCFPRRGKPVILVALAVRLNFAFCSVFAVGASLPLVPLGPRFPSTPLGALISFVPVAPQPPHQPCAGLVGMFFGLNVQQ